MIDPGHVEILAFAVDPNPKLVDFRRVAAHKEMHIASEMSELRTVITTDRAGTDDRDSKIRQLILTRHAWF